MRTISCTFSKISKIIEAGKNMEEWQESGQPTSSKVTGSAGLWGSAVSGGTGMWKSWCQQNSRVKTPQDITRPEVTRAKITPRLGKFDRTGITCRMISIFNLYCPLARDHLPPTLPSSVWPMGATDSGRSKSGVPSSTAGYALCKMQLRRC